MVHFGARLVGRLARSAPARKQAMMLCPDTLLNRASNMLPESCRSDAVPLVLELTPKELGEIQSCPEVTRKMLSEPRLEQNLAYDRCLPLLICPSLDK